MTYDSSVFSRGNYYKDNFYFKNTKGFRHIFTIKIPLHSKKNVPCCFERDNPSGRQPHPLPNQGSGGGFRPKPVKNPAHLRPGKIIPPRKPGRAKFQGRLADRIGRGHESASFPMLQNYPAAISSLRQSRNNPGNTALHTCCSSRQSRSSHHPPAKAACPDCKHPGRPCRITGSATIAIRQRPIPHSGRAGITPYSHSIVAGGFEEMS